MLIYLSEAKKAFNLTSRYIDDVQSIKNLNLGGKKFKQNMHKRIQSTIVESHFIDIFLLISTFSVMLIITALLNDKRLHI